MMDVRFGSRLLVLPLAALMIGCEAAERNAAQRAETGGPAAAPTPGEPGSRASAVVLFLGTSLTAGYGLSPGEAFPARIQEKIYSAGLPYRVANAGVSGETSAGARRRAPWLLRQPFDVLVLETGANDMLRGADLDSTEANIQAIVDRVRSQRPEARIILVGMLAPPNLGSEYAERFRTMYEELAARNGLAFVPFLLEGVGGLREMNLPDGIHPNAAGQRRVAENVWRVLEPELRSRAAASGAPPPPS